MRAFARLCFAGGLALTLPGAGVSWAASSWYLLVPPRSEYNERAPDLSAYKILE